MLQVSHAPLAAAHLATSARAHNPPESWLSSIKMPEPSLRGLMPLKELNAILQEKAPCKWTWPLEVEGVAFHADQSLYPSDSCMGVPLKPPHHHTGLFE